MIEVTKFFFLLFGVCIYITHQIKKCIYNKKSVCICVCRVVLINILELQFDLQTKIPDFALTGPIPLEDNYLLIEREREGSEVMALLALAIGYIYIYIVTSRPRSRN